MTDTWRPVEGFNVPLTTIRLQVEMAMEKAEKRESEEQDSDWKSFYEGQIVAYRRVMRELGMERVYFSEPCS